MTDTGNIILFFLILQRVSHKNFTVNISDAKWRVTRRKSRVGEAVGINLMKIFVIGFHLACMEICHKQEIVAASNAQGCAFVNGAVNPKVGAVIDRDDGVGLVERRVPA